MDLIAEDIEKLLLATLLGAIIGLDREYRGKSAGFRTMMLVTLGSTLIALVSYKMAIMDIKHNSDVTRIASNIATGIGFIGAGIIFKNEKGTKGLTTAATVWAAAGIGMSVAIGTYLLAIAATVIVWITLFFLQRVEDMAQTLLNTRIYKLSWSVADGLSIDQEYFRHQKFKVEECKHSKSGDRIEAEWTVRGSKKHHDGIVERMLRDQRILTMEF